MQYKAWQTFVLSSSYVAALVLLIIYIKPIIQWIIDFIDIFDPFFAGIIIAFILNRPCMFLEKIFSGHLLTNGSPSLIRTLSIFILYIVASGLLVLVFSYLIPALISSIQDLLKNLDTYSGNLQSLINKIVYFFGFKKSFDMSHMLAWTGAYADTLARNMIDLMAHIINLTSEGMSLIGRFFFSILFSVYLLKGKEKLMDQGKRFFARYLPTKAYNKSSEILQVITNVFGHYFIGQIIEASILCALCFLGMVIFGFGYPVLISALIGVTSLVPMIGPYIGGIIAFRILVMIDPTQAVWFVIFIILLQQLEGYFIYPRIVGKAIGLQGIWVLLSIMAGASLGGVTGIVLAVPAAAVIYTMIKRDIAKEKPSP